MSQRVETREEKHMPQRAEIEEDEFSARVIAAFADLARLSLRTATLRVLSVELLNQFATDLIHQLVILCDARQGGIFLTPLQTGENVVDDGVAQPAFLLLASTQMSAEEAHTALARYPLTSAPLQWSADLPPTLVWRRSPGQPEQTASQQAPQFHVLLLLAWSAQEQDLEARTRAMRLLPFLASAVDAILLHLLAALHERGGLQALFPAELLATIGHEFRGPLTTISGYATTLIHHDQQFATPERLEFLEAISEASAHLGKLVDRFLDLAQFETNTVSFLPTTVDLAALAHEAVLMAKKNRGYPLILTPPLSIPAPGEENVQQSTDVCGDQRWLRTMLDLLLENAITYSPAESIIEVTVEAVDSAHHTALLSACASPDSQQALILPGSFAAHEALVEIQVRDHGMGISPEHLSAIFERFYRVDTRLTREVNGLGLGLTLCKAIVARHRGMLQVESSPGVGSTFHILLPGATTQPSREMI
ncbi:MAG TPA: ATP-binding protein [Ktedonobacteraceae bacterium]|jgi:signal transduction histidine kinase